MRFAQGHKTVGPMRLEPATHRSRVVHSATEPPRGGGGGGGGYSHFFFIRRLGPSIYSYRNY